jgi:uncharacterized repeat protein (TIGR02543 family)
VSYDGNGNSGGSVPVDTTNYEEGDTVTVLGNPNNLTREGYSFTGWSVQADGSGTSYTQGNQFSMATNNVTLFAKWEVTPTFTVVYHGNGNDSGSVPIDGTAYEQGIAVTVLGNSGNLALSAHTFSGWNTAADGSGTGYVQGSQFNMGVSNVDLYAQWTQNPTYTVTYNGNGNDGGSVPVDTTNYEQGQTVTVLGNSGGLSLTDYAFTGWNTQADGNGTGYTQSQTFSMVTENVTLYAQWTYHPTYTVTYTATNVASGSVPLDSTHYEEGQTVTVLGNTGNLVSSVSGKEFFGWTRNATGSFVYYHEGDTFTMGAANEVLRAAWSDANQITLVYDGNGNTSGTVPASANHNSGIWVSAAENTGNLERTGYTFVGWYALSCSFSGCTTHTFAPGEYFLMSTNLPGYNISNNTVTLMASWSPKSTILYNAGTHNGNLGGLAGANAMCEANVSTACGHRSKIRAFLDEGYWTSYTFADIPTLMGIDANLPIVGPNGDQISANWAGLTNGIDRSLSAAGVLPADTHWWSGGGVNTYSDEFFSSNSACVSAGEPWTTAEPSDMDSSDWHWGAAGSSSTTDRQDWINEITTVVTSLPGGGTRTINYRLECSDQHYVLCVCGE